MLEPGDTFNARTLPRRLGERRCAWLGHHLARAPKERPGRVNHPLILSYSTHARRGGRFLGVDLDGAPQWDGGTPLPAPSDEWPWCAYLQSAALLAVLLPGETPPHGLRASVAELVADAHAANTLVEMSQFPSYEPVPGDLMVTGRQGQSPLLGGFGHVQAIIQNMGDGRALTIGGNELDTIRQQVEPWTSALAFIQSTAPIQA